MPRLGLMHHGYWYIIWTLVSSSFCRGVEISLLCRINIMNIKSILKVDRWAMLQGMSLSFFLSTRLCFPESVDLPFVMINSVP